MPVNPNIALGTQPQQPVNYLAQMGQAMALRAASQDIQGNEDLRNFYASGGNASTPEGARALMAANPKMGMQILKNTAETQKIQGDALSKSFANAREGLLMVRTPEDLLNYSISQFSDPLIGPSLKARGLTPETVAANLQKELSTSGFDAVLKKSAMGLDGWYKDQTSRRNQDVSSGASYGQLALAREKFNLEQTQQAELSRILRGEAPAGAPAVTGAPMGGGGGAPAVAGGPAVSGAVAPVAAPATAPNVNALNAGATPAAAANVNLLTEGAVPPQIAQMQSQIGQLIKVGTPKAIAAADALIKQHNMLMPSQQIVQNQKGEYIRVDQRGGSSTPVLDASGQPLVGKLPPPVFESEYTKIVGKAAGERDVGITTSAAAAAGNLPKLYETLDQLKTSDAITGFGAGIIKNIESFRTKFANDIKAGKKVADTEILDAMLGSDVFPMIQSLGIGAKGMDTPAEREYLRSVMTGTINMDKAALIKLTEIRKNIEERAVKRYNEAVDSGKLDRFFETQGIKPEKIEAPKYEPRLKQVDQDALNWAKSNANDPRAAQILQRLGM
jgi:hypothetical protein